MFEQDIARIFGRCWIYVGVEAEIAEPGDFFTVEIGKDSIIIVRDDDMSIHAFHNVCRHRGARLRSAGSGIVGNLVCPYHQWTYNLRGELIHNDHYLSDEEKASGRVIMPCVSRARCKKLVLDL